MEIPDWLKAEVESEPRIQRLRPPKAACELSVEERELEQQTFGIAFESLLEQMAEGVTFAAFCLRYLDPFRRPLSSARFRTWIFANAGRKKAYYGAKVLAAEAIEDDLLRIADGLNPDGSLTAADPIRSKLMVDTRWKLLPIYNRERYSPTTQIEQNTTVTVKSAESMPTAELRRLIHEKLALVRLRNAAMDGLDPGEEERPDLPPDPQPLDPFDADEADGTDP